MKRFPAIRESKPFVVSLSNHGRRGAALFALRQAQGERRENLRIPDGVRGSLLGKLLAKFVKRKPSRAKCATPKKKVARSPSKKKPASPKKAAGAKPAGDEIGRVVAFFRIPVVAVVRVKREGLKLGDRVWIKGHTTDLRLTLTSMQINHQPVQKIGKGAEAGVKVPSRARIGDRVYRISG